MCSKFISTLAILACLAGAGPARALSEDATYSSGLFLSSRLASRQLDFDSAAQFTQLALELDPKNPGLTERLFQTELLRGNVQAAEALAQAVVRFNSQERSARLVLGMKEFHARRYKEARIHFEEAAYTPFGTLTSSLLNAWAFAGEGELNPALKELERLSSQEAFANYKALHTALITDYLGSGMRADAAYRKAYQLAPNSLRIAMAYGNFLERQNRKADAAAIYNNFLSGGQGNVLVKKALADLSQTTIPPAFVATPLAGAGEVLFSIASALNSEQGADAALIFAQLALPASTDKAFVLTTLAGVQSGLQLQDQAIATYRKIPTESILRDYADVQIGLNLYNLDRNDEAIATLKTVVARDPKNTEALLTLTGVYRANDRFQEAVEGYSKALTLLPPQASNLSRVYYDRGIAYERLKQFDKAEPDFRKSLEINKDDPAVLNYLGYSMIDRGVNLDEALGMVKKAVVLRPNDGYITDSLGWAYYVLGNYEQAVNYLERAVELIPSDATIADHLGDAYWQVNRKDEAKFQWQHAIDNGAEAKELPKIKLKLKEGLGQAGSKPAIKG